MNETPLEGEDATLKRTVEAPHHGPVAVSLSRRQPFAEVFAAPFLSYINTCKNSEPGQSDCLISCKSLKVVAFWGWLQAFQHLSLRLHSEEEDVEVDVHEFNHMPKAQEENTEKMRQRDRVRAHVFGIIRSWCLREQQQKTGQTLHVCGSPLNLRSHR